MATQTHARTRLESIVEGFDRDAQAARNQIRELLESDPQSFREGVVRIFKSPPSSLRGIQFVVSVLVGDGFLVPVLGDPSFSLEEAVALARTAMQVDPMTDVNLAKKLADDGARGEPAQHASRLMDVLGEISSGPRITSSLMRLWRNSDPQMRSKAVLLIGRSNGSAQWAQSRLAETDPRMRANAVEGLWGVETAEAKEVHRKAARDGNNRVAGNALFALYRMGETWAIAELFKMAASDSPLFRSSAAWAMGETRDPRFSETLARMVGEADAIVRKRAFSALSRLKAASKMRNGSVWGVAGRVLPPLGNTRQLLIEVSPLDGSAAPNLMPTQFILSENSHQVTQYHLEPGPPVETLAVTFLLPHTADPSDSPWVQAALVCLNWKRPSDQWCITFYPPGDEKTEAPDPPQFTADGHIATAALHEAPAKATCPAFWDGVRNSVQAIGAPEGGVRHLIIYNQSSPPAADMAELIAAATASNTSVHAISLARCPALEDLCRGTQGNFRLAQSESEISDLVKEAYLALVPRFLVSYQSVAPGARTLHVRVFDATGGGENTISLTVTNPSPAVPNSEPELRPDP